MEEEQLLNPRLALHFLPQISHAPECFTAKNIYELNEVFEGNVGVNGMLRV